MFQSLSRSILKAGEPAKSKMYRRLPTVAITLFASAAVVRALIPSDADAAANAQVIQTDLQTTPTVIARAVGNSLDEATSLQSMQLAQVNTSNTVSVQTTVYDDEMLLARTRELMEVDSREVDEVAERLKEIIRARYDADQMNAKSMMTITELRRQIADFEALLQQANDRQNELDAERATLEEKLNLVVSERDGALDNLNALDSQIQQQLGSVQALKSETATASEQLAEKDRQIADLNSELQRLIGERDSAAQNANGLQSELVQNQSAIDALNAQLADVVAERDGTQSELAESQQALAESQQALTLSNESLAQAQQALVDNEQALSLTNEDLARTQQALADNEEALSLSNEELARTQQVLAENQNALDEKKGLLDQLNGLVAEKQDSLGLFEQQLGSNERALSDLKDQVNRLASERDNARAQVADVEQMLGSKTDELTALEDQINVLSAERDNALMQINDLQGQLAEAQSSADNFLSERDNLAGELSLFENKAAEVGSSFVNEQQAHTQTRANLFALQREADDLRRNLDRMSGERDVLLNDTTQLKASRAELNGQLLAMKGELDTRQKELQAALSSISNLNTRIADLTSERDALQVKVEDLGTQVVALQSSMTSSEKDYANELAASRQQFLDQTRELESEIASRDQNIDLMQQQIDAVNNEFETASQQAAEQLAAKDQAIITLEDKLASLERDRTQLMAVKQGNEGEISKLLGSIDELTASRDASSAKIEQLDTLNKELNAGMIESTNALEALKADGEQKLAKLKGDIVDLSNTRDDYAAKIAQLEALNQELGDKLKSSRSQFDLLTAESGERFNLLDAKLAKLQSRESLFKSNALEAADKIQELANNNVELQSELEKARGMFAQVENDLGTANSEISVYEAELNVANQKLRDIMNAQRLAEAERDRIAAEAELLRVSLTEELNDAKLENIVVQNARADNSIPIRLGNADFFETGSARLTKEGGENLTKLAEIIHTYHNRRIVVEGHTDTVPIGLGLKFRYASNWELSVARAAAAVRHMQSETDIDPRSLSAAGYGEFKPVADNSTEAGRRQNRRVEVVLYPTNNEYQNITAIDE